MKKENVVITPKHVSLAELLIELARIPHATPATIVALTDPTMNKFGSFITDKGVEKMPNPFIGRVKKKVVSNVFIGFVYENSVNNVLKKEGKEADFEAKPRKWGKKIDNSCLVEHKGSFYLECRFLKSPTPEYFLDGNPMDKNQIVAFLPEKKSNAKHQGVEEEHEVVLRDFKLDSLVEIKVMGKHFIVR